MLEATSHFAGLRYSVGIAIRGQVIWFASTARVRYMEHLFGAETGAD